MSEPILFCRGGGCTAKLGPGMLSHVLQKLPPFEDPNLLVGFHHSDDAAVYRLTDDLAMVQTLDFFPPMVEDPYLFGQIAAANAMSDVYAMGGEVKTALNIVCFPETMDLNILGRILQGGSEKVREAGGVLAGGHSIYDQEVKYGLSVTGLIHPDRVLENHTPKPGDRLILTKPLGVGLLMTASRAGALSKAGLRRATRSMSTLNKKASEIFAHFTVHACTDVTGFGLLGHLSEMIPSELSAELWASEFPVFPEALDCANEFFLTAAAQKNRNFVGSRASFEDVPFAVEELLFDPQTSGGLLGAVPKEEAPAVLAELSALGLPCGIIGKVCDTPGGILHVVPEPTK